ncbi:ATP-binding protein [Myxococcota bacterium]|nr:ATP-binding protein [Myxococcota bacterium]
MEDRTILRERAHNLWTSLGRKAELVARSTTLDPLPQVELGQIGGLSGPREEIQTYAYAATDREVYERWGTHPPTGLLLIGRKGSGKRLLAETLASLTATSFLRVDVPRLVIEIVQQGAKAQELLNEWTQTLTELPPTTALFDELEFSRANEIGTHRPDLPIGPIMDFLLDLVDRTIRVDGTLVVGSTSQPGTLRQAFVQPGRFERVVEVNPIFPDDIVAALEIHAALAEKRAGHGLFDNIDWEEVVRTNQQPSTGDWIHILHSVLRRKARLEASSETPPPVSTEDLLEESERYKRANLSLYDPSRGNYL